MKRNGTVKIYLCKYCRFKKKADGDNLCPRCAHYMAEQEWKMVDESWLDDEYDYNEEDEDD